MKTAIIAGASGLVGGNLLSLLLESSHYQKVISISRNELPVQHHKLLQLVIDFDKLCEYEPTITGDALFCCLGTTRKQSPDPVQYRKIEFLYPSQLAGMAAKNGAQQVHYVSSIGADNTSGNFYLKLKGETESALANSGLPAVHIYQPSVITGDRKQVRPMEKFIIGVMKFADPLLFGALKKYRSISAQTIARAMYNQSLSTAQGLFIHPSDHIKNLA